MNKNKNTTYQSLCDTAKVVLLRGKFITKNNTYIKKQERRLNLQNIQIGHIIQQNKQTTQLKNQQKTLIDISPKKTYRWPVGTWEDAQPH